MSITAQQVKELREATGVGMMDCKKALTETGGDMEAAVDWLRTRGLAKAAKKAGRVAAEGLVGIYTEGKQGAIVEVNSETDFVARNEQFQGIVANIAKLAIEAGGDVHRRLRPGLHQMRRGFERIELGRHGYSSLQWVCNLMTKPAGPV